MMDFKEITADVRTELQAVTFRSGLRNCNFTFANLVGWQPEFGTCYCIFEDALVLRYCFDGQMAYLVNSEQMPTVELVDALRQDAASRGEDLLLMGLENSPVMRS